MSSPRQRRRLSAILLVVVAAAGLAAACSATPGPTPPVQAASNGVVDPPVAPAGSTPSRGSATLRSARPPSSLAPPLTPDPGGGSILSAGGIEYAGTVACPSAAACSPRLDIYAPDPARAAASAEPAAAQGGSPVIVLLRGGPSGPGGRAYLTDFARQLAAAGALVFNADYRDTRDADGGGDPASFDDAACAVRTARAWAGAYGGNPDLITIVGHSLGAYVGSVVSLAGDTFDETCPAGGGSALPEAFVGLAGPYQLSAAEVSGDFTTMFGVPWSALDAGLAAVDPFRLLDGRASLRVRLIYGTADTSVNPAASLALGSALAAAGYRVDVLPIQDQDHNGLINPGGAAALVGRLVLEVATAGR